MIESLNTHWSAPGPEQVLWTAIRAFLSSSSLKRTELVLPKLDQPDVGTQLYVQTYMIEPD